MNKFIVLTVSLAALAVTGASWAGGHGGNPAVKARKAHMQLYAYNLGKLGGMAKGEVEYNAEAAQTAANNLATLTTVSQAGYWAPGTSNAELGEETRALPGLWGADSTAMQIGGEMGEAITQLASVAGDGQEALGAALGGVGKACGACHKAYRQPAN